jgi:hypothetical protein
MRTCLDAERGEAFHEGAVLAFFPGDQDRAVTVSTREQTG